MWSIVTEPSFAIGQRCILLETPAGNVLWDCMTYLDEETVEFIKGKGGLEAIVISHPHYYTTHLDWAEAFRCPVYVAKEDEEWLNRPDSEDRRRFITGDVEEIVTGVVAAKPGGHFPGSLVLCWDKKLFIADTLVIVPVCLHITKSSSPFAMKTDATVVRSLPHRSPTRHNKFRLHVLNPKHASAAAFDSDENVASSPQIGIRERARCFCG